MPMFQEDPVPPPAAPRLSAHESVAVELDWAMSAAVRDEPIDRPVLRDLYRDHADLRARVRALWSLQETLSYPGFVELTIAAYQGGMLFSGDGDALIACLGDLFSVAPTWLTLASEKAEDRSRILRRLQLLRSSTARREGYIDVVRDVWALIRPTWEAEGRQAVRSAIGDRRARLDKPGSSWREFAAHECNPSDIERLVDALGTGGEIAVVPAYFTWKGLFLDLPGLVLVGVRADSTSAEARARTELLARRLKALSDPTRLAILHALARGGMTITELASAFALAQPTVSNHVKTLREAGVVGHGANGRRRELVVERDVVAGMLTDLQDVVGSPVPPVMAG